MTAKTIYKKLTEQRKDLEALHLDLPKIEGLPEQHRQAADGAKRTGAHLPERARPHPDAGRSPLAGQRR